MSGARFIVRPFKAEDALAIVLGERGAADLAWHDRKRAARMAEEAAGGFTVVEARAGPEHWTDRVLFCGGIMERHPQYATLWALYAEGIGRAAWAFLLNRTRLYIDGLPHRRVDAWVELNRDRAGALVPMAARSLRWAEACGLFHDATLRQAAPDGGDIAIMRRIEV